MYDYRPRRWLLEFLYNDIEAVFCIIIKYILMKKKKYLFLLSLMTVVMGHAQVYDKLILTDGSMVEGRIAVQHPGKDIVFQSVDQEISYPMEDILAIERVKRQADDLSGILAEVAPLLAIAETYQRVRTRRCRYPSHLLHQLLASTHVKDDPFVIIRVMIVDVAAQILRMTACAQVAGLVLSLVVTVVVVTDCPQYHNGDDSNDEG